MKKILMSCAVACALTFGITFGCMGGNEIASPVYAEEPPVVEPETPAEPQFEQVTYTGFFGASQETSEMDFEVVLTSSTDCFVKITLWNDRATNNYEIETFQGTYELKNSCLTIDIGEPDYVKLIFQVLEANKINLLDMVDMTPPAPEVPEEPEISFEERFEELKVWAKDKWDNMILPLLIAFLSSGGVAIILKIVMNVLSKRKMKEQNQKIDTTLDSVSSFLSEQEKILVNSKEINSSSQEIQKLLDQGLKELEDLVKENTQNVASIEKIKPIIALLSGIETKLAQCNPEAVRAGVVNDIEQLSKLIKELASNETNKE